MQRDRKEYSHFYMIILLFFGVLVISASFYLLLRPSYTGRITAIGGQVTRADISGYVQSVRWIGLYGNLTSNSSVLSNYTFAGGDVSFIYLYSGNLQDGSLIYISTAESIDFSALEPAGHADIDSFMNISPSDLQASNRTFRHLMNFTINGTAMELITLRTNSVSGDFFTGALKQNGTLVFVTRYVEGGVGFDNTSIDFQVILPVPPAGNVTYYFYPELSAELNCSPGFSLMSRHSHSGDSIILEMGQLPGADGYRVYYIDDAENFSFTGAPYYESNSTLINDTSFTNSTRRYYKAYALGQGSQCEALNLAGVSRIPIIKIADYEYNLVTFPYVFQNSSLESVLSSISGNYSRVYEFNNTNKQYNIYLAGLWDDIIDIVFSRGYWIKAESNTTLVVSGALYQNISAELSPDYSLLGYPAISGNSSVEAVHQSISGNYSRVYEFNNTNKQYNIYLAGLWDDIINVQPDLGYWIRTDSNVTFTYP